MTSTFFGLDIATRALQTQQTLVDIAGQNIANASTPGYSRQTAEVQATAPYPIPVFNQTGVGQLGTGVEVATVTRARDTFLDGQVRAQLSTQGNWNAQNTALSNVQAVINEPSTTGLASLMTQYFSAWQNVANNPTDASARSSLIQQGVALAQGFNTTVGQLQTQQQGLDQQVGLTVSSVNDYATQLANLNQQIGQVSNAGMQPNDLEDQRDHLLDQLSSLVKISTVTNTDGQVSVYVGNHALVDRSTANQMTTGVPSGQQFSQPEWSDGSLVTPGDGQLQGELTARDQLLGGQIQSVNAVAARVIQQVNALHASGVDLNGNPGVAFFSGTDAVSMAVNPQLLASNGTDLIAAARTYADTSSGSTVYSYGAGDASNALAIAELANSTAQLDPSSQLQPGSTIAGPPAMTASAVNVNGASSATTYTFGTDPSNGQLQITSSPGGGSADVTATIVPNGSSQLMTVDGLGVRLAVSVPNGTSLNSALAGLAGQRVTTGANASTVGNQYAEFVSALGVQASTAQGQSQNQTVLVNQLQQQQQSTSGVSIDEETTNLIQYQRAYEASARVVSVIDSMLNTLINNTGVTG